MSGLYHVLGSLSVDRFIYSDGISLPGLFSIPITKSFEINHTPFETAVVFKRQGEDGGKELRKSNWEKVPNYQFNTVRSGSQSATCVNPCRWKCFVPPPQTTNCFFHHTNAHAYVSCLPGPDSYLVLSLSVQTGDFNSLGTGSTALPAGSLWACMV